MLWFLRRPPATTPLMSPTCPAASLPAPPARRSSETSARPSPSTWRACAAKANPSLSLGAGPSSSRLSHPPPPLRIVHGKGTGTLRRAVREMLSKHALVRSHASAPPREGGDGVTVVELAT